MNERPLPATNAAGARWPTGPTTLRVRRFTIPTRQTLHFICGKAGSGKTTLARQLAEREGAVVFIEDEWLLALFEKITSLEHFIGCSRKVRAVIGPMALQILKAGVPVVFDFGGNTVTHRKWVRTLFESAGAEHVLHVIEASDESCLAGIRKRNAERPEGVWYGDVSEALFHEVTKYFVPPAEAEGFVVETHAHRAGSPRDGA